MEEDIKSMFAEQMNMFPELENEWQKEWHDMPEFNQEDKAPFKQIIISFKNFSDVKAFGELMQQTVTPKTQSMWFPKAEIERYIDKRYKKEDNDD